MLVTIFVVIMFTLEWSKLSYRFNIPHQWLLSIVIFVSGLMIIAIGGFQFRKEKTTVNPINPENTTHLVTTGLYKISRNPMYVGFLAWLLACVIFMGNIVNLLLLPVFIIMVNKLYIQPEEKALERLFGNQFTEYTKRVRRWL
jgi:protein-S-isoprenylcysteine O-methyltransferase Ste14